MESDHEAAGWKAGVRALSWVHKIDLIAEGKGVCCSLRGLSRRQQMSRCRRTCTPRSRCRRSRYSAPGFIATPEYVLRCAGGDGYDEESPATQIHPSVAPLARAGMCCTSPHPRHSRRRTDSFAIIHHVYMRGRKRDACSHPGACEVSGELTRGEKETIFR